MRKFFFLCTFIFAALLISINSAGKSASIKEIVLQDDSLLVAFDSNSGALIKFERKSTNWMIQRRAELGVSFRLLVPLPDRRYNFVFGQKQNADKVEKISESEVRLQWKNLVSEYGGVLQINITANVTLKDGKLTFIAEVENNSPLTIETIDYPYFGDLNAPMYNDKMSVQTMWYGNLETDQIYPSFNNSKGYWGVFVPTKTFDSFRSLFCLIQASGQGLYVEMQDPTQPYLLQYTFEQHPGVIESINNTVPHGDEISGLPVHLEFRTCHFIFLHPHSTLKLAPVTFSCYKGDWQAGVDLYKKWRATWFKPAHVPEWITEVNSWMQLQINSPEQDYRVSYNNLIKYGEECAANGVKAIQLVGWNHGGQDGGDPSQDIDPGLGTWKELYDAIAKIQNMGVKIILFGKLNWADRSTDWYKKELYKYAATDPYGVPYEQGGYSYYTPTQIAGINIRRRDVMDFLCPAYQSIIIKEFRKVLALGASGWLFDENCHHGPVTYSFASDHGYTPPGFIYSGDMPVASQLHSVADKISPDFLFAGEGHQDWLMQYYPCSYFRINGGSIPVSRYIDAKAPLMVAVTGIDDREMLNLVLMNRYIISYEPFNFKGHLTDFPMTLAYGMKIDNLRRKYKTWLWDAEFRNNEGANVIADGSFRYSVFVTFSGKRAVVVVNTETGKAISAQLKLPNHGNLVVASPEQSEARPTSGQLNIPARSAVVVMEQ
jgi:hypothetical protein